MSETDLVGINAVNRNCGALPIIKVDLWFTLTKCVCFDRFEVGTTTVCVQSFLVGDETDEKKTRSSFGEVRE